MLLDENDKLENECARLRKENEELRATKSTDVFATLSGDEPKLQFYSGLPSLASFLCILQMLVVTGFTGFRKVSPHNTLLIMLMKLKLACKNRDLAYRFGINRSYVSSILTTRLPMLAAVARTFIKWPTREAVKANMPNCFRTSTSTIRRTRVILDCFEVFAERPKSLTPRAKLWSNYKSHSTVKFLVGISPSGAITFLSDGWGGRASDKQITLESPLLSMLDPYGVVMADRGFLIQKEFEAWKIKVIMPHFTRGQKQMTQQQVQESRSLARVRIHVERVIGRMRRQFAILSNVLPLNLVPQVDNIAVICAGLTNLHKPVV